VTSVQQSSDIDLFSDAQLEEPYGVFTAIRESAPVVWMSAHQAWASARYGVARSVLRDWETFSSAQGVGLTPELNAMLEGTLLASDPPLHDQLRGILSARLAPKALRSATDFIQREADDLIAELSSVGRFDAISDLAQRFSLGVVSELIGLPEEVRGKLIEWGDATINLLGPLNGLAQTSLPVAEEMFVWLQGVVKSDLVEGGMGRDIYEAAEAGKIDQASAAPLLSAYVAASLDTTTSLLGLAIGLFTEYPDAWRRVREDTATIPSVLLEVARYASPVQWVSRVATVDTDIDGVTIGAGQRVILLLAGANRDPSHYEDADTFDIDRKPVDHLAFSYGVHSCAGQGLARLEATCLFTALAPRVASFELAGTPIRKLSNLTRGWQSLPIQINPA
jgi:cytochrome P450